MRTEKEKQEEETRAEIEEQEEETRAEQEEMRTKKKEKEKIYHMCFDCRKGIIIVE